MAIRFMLDTDILGDLTDHAELMATYSDLVPDHAALTALRAKYPNSEVILIDRGLGDPTGEATVMDIETGALTIGDAPARYDTWHSQGRQFITVYVNRANRAAVDQAMGDRKPWHWEATLDGSVLVPGGLALRRPAVVQCLTETDLGVHADGSLVLEDGWHPRAAPTILATIKRDLHGAISMSASLGSELHRMASAIGG